MNGTSSRVARIGWLVAYALLGAGGTAGTALVLLWLSAPVRPLLYDGFYLAVGPWSATEAATIIQFSVVGVAALGIPTVLAASGRYGRDGASTLGVGLLALLVGMGVLLGATTLLGLDGFPIVIGLFAAVVLAVPVGLRRLGMWPRPAATFAGSVPVLVLLVLLLGFGLGWGGGYDVRAERVDPGVANGSTVVDLAESPHLRADLLSTAACAPYDEGVCHLTLRGYEHEAAVGRFLARHGVRCSYLNAPQGYETKSGALIAEHDGEFYRISCLAYGD